MPPKAADCTFDFLLSLEERKNLLLRREILANPSSPEAAVLAGLAELEYMWPQKAEIRIHFLDESHRAQVEEVLGAEWQPHINLKFKYVDKVAGSDVRVSFKAEPGRYWSRLGAQARHPQFAKRPTVSLGFPGGMPARERRRLILHEFGHALGLLHEHTNPASGLKLDQQKAVDHYFALFKGQLSREAVWEQIRLLEYNSSRYLIRPFDPKSIMMYPVLKHLLRPDSEWDPAMSEWNNDLARSDTDIVREMYPPSSPPPPTPKATVKNVPDRKAVLELDGDEIEDAVMSETEVDTYALTVKKAGAYEVFAVGDAYLTLTIDGPNADGKVVTTLTQEIGASYASWFAKGKYTVKVTASSGDTTGKYTIQFRTYEE